MFLFGSKIIYFVLEKIAVFKAILVKGVAFFQISVICDTFLF